MAEAENVGYKRTKRGENPMPNELYDFEFAPNTIDTKQILEGYDREIKIFKEQLSEIKTELEAVNKKIDGKETDALKKKAEKLNGDIEALNTKIEQTETVKAQVVEIFKNYYEDDKLKAEFAERTDTELINHFKNGLLSRYKSDDIVLRTTELLTILDNIRKDVVWE
jgi:type I restriction enzyme M protein